MPFFVLFSIVCILKLISVLMFYRRGKSFNCVILSLSLSLSNNLWRVAPPECLYLLLILFKYTSKQHCLISSILQYQQPVQNGVTKQPKKELDAFCSFLSFVNLCNTVVRSFTRESHLYTSKKQCTDLKRILHISYYCPEITAPPHTLLAAVLL